MLKYINEQLYAGCNVAFFPKEREKVKVHRKIFMALCQRDVVRAKAKT